MVPMVASSSHLVGHKESPYGCLQKHKIGWGSSSLVRRPVSTKDK